MYRATKGYLLISNEVWDRVYAQCFVYVYLHSFKYQFYIKMDPLKHAAILYLSYIINYGWHDKMLSLH